jgi:hypothetical protein
MRELLDIAGQHAMTPFDRARPPWEAVLVGGLEGGRAALLLKLTHVLSDGMGLAQLLGGLHSRTREPTPDKPQPPAPVARPEGVVEGGGELVERAHRGGARHAGQESGLAEEAPGAEAAEGLLAAAAVAQHLALARQDHVEAIGGLALADDDLAGRGGPLLQPRRKPPRARCLVGPVAVAGRHLSLLI